MILVHKGVSIIILIVSLDLKLIAAVVPDIIQTAAEHSFASYHLPSTRELPSVVMQLPLTILDTSSSMFMDFEDVDVSWLFDQIPTSQMAIFPSDQPNLSIPDFSNELSPADIWVPADLSRLPPCMPPSLYEIFML